MINEVLSFSCGILYKITFFYIQRFFVYLWLLRNVLNAFPLQTHIFGNILDPSLFMPTVYLLAGLAATNIN